MTERKMIIRPNELRELLKQYSIAHRNHEDALKQGDAEEIINTLAKKNEAKEQVFVSLIQWIEFNVRKTIKSVNDLGIYNKDDFIQSVHRQIWEGLSKAREKRYSAEDLITIVALRATSRACSTLRKAGKMVIPSDPDSYVDEIADETAGSSDADARLEPDSEQIKNDAMELIDALCRDKKMNETQRLMFTAWLTNMYAGCALPANQIAEDLGIAKRTGQYALKQAKELYEEWLAEHDSRKSV